MSEKKKNLLQTGILLALVAAICAYAGSIFLFVRRADTIIPAPGLTEVRMLSEYLPALAGTRGDTEIYVFQGEEEGGSLLVLGGTHANEPAGYMAAIVMAERADVKKGTLYVIPHANNSGFTANDAGDACPLYLHFDTASGSRAFRFGSRATNPIDQWPDQDTYVHAASGQTLSGSEQRNLNRSYPGRPDGTLTEQVAYAITELIKADRIDMTVDLHEASPEYPNNNSTVAHQRALPIASRGLMYMLMEGIDIKLEASPENYHGLTHRELGDYTDTFALLMETSGATQGRVRGATSEMQALTGLDKCYELLGTTTDLLYVPYDENGHPIEERVGRHLSGVLCYVQAMGEIYPEKEIVIENIPRYSELINSSIAEYLN